MKKIAISTLAVLLACPAFAGNPNQGSSWTMWGLDPYIGLRGGMGYTNLNYRFDNDKESMTDFVFHGRAAMGLEICDTVRSEVEWSLYGKSKDSANGVETSTKLQTLLLNAYMEFGDYQIIRPFLGVGGGIGFVKVDANNNAPTYDKTSFSAMGTLGVSFDMEMFAVDVAARYNYVDVASGLHNFGGDIGIRFMF